MITVKRFTATWCGPCKMVAPVITTLTEDYKSDTSVNFEVIDVDENPTEAEQYTVRAVPTVLILKDGKEVERIIGARNKSVYQEAIEKAK